MAGQQPNQTAPTLADIPLATSTIRKEVVKEVFGVSATPGDLASGTADSITQHGYDAFYEVTEQAKWWTMVSVRDDQPGPTGDALPDPFNELFKVMWVQKATRQFKSVPEGHIYFRHYVEPLQRRIVDHYTGNWNQTSAGTDVITPRTLRNSALAQVLRQRTPWFPTMAEVDRCVRSQFVYLWSMRAWSFTKRLVKLTLNTDGDVLASGGFTFDGMASKRIHLLGANGGRRTMVWLDSERMAERLRDYTNATTGVLQTGTPKYFSDSDHGDTKTIIILPRPDQSYTGTATIVIGAPAFDNADSVEGLKMMPAEFRWLLRDMVTAELMHIGGREDTDSARFINKVAADLANRAASFDDKGASRYTASNTMHRGWLNSLPSRSIGMIG